MNDNNRTQKEDEAMAIIGYTFQNRDVLREALLGKGSFVTQIGDRMTPNQNRVLAIFGDRLISLVIAAEAYAEDSMTTVEVSRRFTDLANENRFVALCDNLGLSQCIVVSPFNGGLVSAKNKSSTLEAIVAAVYLDAGMEAARQVMEKMGIIGPAASHLL